MLWLWSLFAPRGKRRCFALLDAHGLCCGFHESRVAPQGAGWVEVSECRLAWLQRPLPAEARIPQVSSQPTRRQPLPA